MQINEIHFEKLKSKECDIEQKEVGHNAFEWAKYVFDDPEIYECCEKKKYSRKNLEDFIKKTTEPLSLTIAILSWGGMRRDQAKKLFRNADIDYKLTLLPIIEKLKSGKCNDRKAAYKLFFDARNRGELKGLGVAYYTKLICFLNPDLKGYIMDQWTAKSINLLYGQFEDGDVRSCKNPIVKLDYNWVSDKNDGNDYEKFCERIKNLAKRLGCTPLKAEERIFSVGGKKKGAWRSYVVETYSTIKESI